MKREQDLSELVEKIRNLPDDAAREVIDFTDFLARRGGRDDAGRQEETAWMQFSVTRALGDDADEGGPSYSLEDLRERWS